jgi:hypothetical protein
MNKIYSILLVSILITGACRSGKLTSNPQLQGPSSNKGVAATVVDARSIAGCGFMLQLQDSSLLNPDVLEEPFRQDGLKVYVQYSEVKQIPGTCMRGRNVHIIQVNK